MKLLLDTQCWIWMAAAPERFLPDVLDHIRDPDCELFLSAASVWEIVVKHALGKLRLPREPASLVPDLLNDTRTLTLPIDHHHALRVGRLPPHHRDPFDRLLIAQAQVERLRLVTSDSHFAPYEVDVLWAVSVPGETR